MSTPAAIPTQNPVVRLVSLALEQGGSAGLPDLLAELARLTHSDGCILWQETPSKTGQLFILADYFTDQVPWEERYLDADRITSKIACTGDPTDDPRVVRPELDADFQATEYFERSGVQRFCVAAVRMMDDKHAALSLFRRELTEFSEPDLELFRELAQLIPPLIRAILDTAGIALIRDVNEELERAETEVKGRFISEADDELPVQRVVGMVRKAFRSYEASVYLLRNPEGKSEYRLVATTCLSSIQTKLFSGGEKGFTAWVLQNGTPLSVYDLANWDKEAKPVTSQHPGLERVPEEMAEVVRAVRETVKNAPISFIAQPIIASGSVIGVIRVCAAMEAPHYYGQIQEKLLGSIATRIGQYWNARLNRRSIGIEINALHNVIQEVILSNAAVLSESGRNDRKMVLLRALEAVGRTFSGELAIDARLHNPSRNELYFEAFYGPAWDEGLKREVELRKARRFALSGDSKGAQVFNTGKALVLPNIPTEDFKSTFDSRWMVIAPITDGTKKYGVLDIRGLGDAPYPGYSREIMELLGHQLGLYLSLYSYQEGLRKSYSNLGHQLKSPLNTAQSRLDKAVKASDLREVREFLRAVRSALRRVRRVSTDIRLFAELEEKGEIPAKLRWTDATEVIGMIKGIVDDHQARADPDKKLGFEIQVSSLASIGDKILLDAVLFEHALSNLCDNALKYSYPHTKVVVSGVRVAGGAQVAVRSEGIPARRAEVGQWTKRNWRSEEAESVDADGTGLGLYIVDHIMRAHRGRLSINVLERLAVEVRLFFGTRP